MNFKESEYLDEMKLSINDILHYINNKKYYSLINVMQEFIDEFAKYYNTHIPLYDEGIELILINNDNEMSNYLNGFSDDLTLNGCPIELQILFSKVISAAKKLISS